MKKIILATIVFVLVGCAEMQQVVNSLPDVLNAAGGGLDISGGLKQALNNGITNQVNKLTQENGFLNNQLVKILLPEELKKVESGLRKIGLGSLADSGIKALNTAASDAVKEATPIFVDAITNMSFNDAKNILMGSENAATQYLQNSTSSALHQKFSPVIKNSFGKVGADKIWTNIISKYNNIPLVTKVNPDLNDYVTQKAMEGVFKMIAVEEQKIRTNVAARSTPLLQQVFAMQDKK
jgi:translation elongation factor EF-G